ncbi:MAG: hypothetical protein DMD32_13955 [Gemmatimonadetes bacterium]|nr:MAG: hypothetical protein DMD32_13955 [Gemmatimonadota bacterium]
MAKRRVRARHAAPVHILPVLILRVALGLVLSYVVLVAVAWLFQERLAFPAPRAPVPDPPRVGVANGEKIELVMKDGTRLAGWYLKPVEVSGASTILHHPPQPAQPAPALLWFYGNGENIATIWPIVRDFQPPHAALLIVDYPGYGGSAGRATEAGMYGASDAVYAALAARPEVDPHRIFVYGRSLGTAAATYTATHHPVAGVILESPFTSAADMARHAYRIFPSFIVRLSLDNLARIRQVRCPVLLFHGTGDRLVPLEMGMRIAAAAAGPVELVLLQGSGHNESYAIGGTQYRDKVWGFVR